MIKASIKLTALLYCFFCFSATAFDPERKALFDCVNPQTDFSPHIDGVKRAIVHHSNFGSNFFYEVEVIYARNFEVRSDFKKVPMSSMYEGRTLIFGNGNFRVKVKRAIPIERYKYPAFVRLPDHRVHSMDWVCKDVI